MWIGPGMLDAGLRPHPAAAAASARETVGEDDRWRLKLWSGRRVIERRFVVVVVRSVGHVVAVGWVVVDWRVVVGWRGVVD